MARQRPAAPELPLFASAPSSPTATERPGEIETWATSRGLRLLVGADEVGRGPLAGPVVAAAVSLPPDHGIEGLDDSKRLAASRRESLAAVIRSRARAAALVELPAAAVDRSNVLRVALQAMACAVRRVVEQVGRPDLVLVDGNQPLALSLPQKTFVGGDHRSENIAAASILAKVYRDALMARYHLCWPVYGFDRNAGYGTSAHREALRTHGPCPIHRRSFRGVSPQK